MNSCRGAGCVVVLVVLYYAVVAVLVVLGCWWCCISRVVLQSCVRGAGRAGVVVLVV